MGYPSSGRAYNLCAPAEGVLALTRVGIDLLALANNHQDDCLEGGLEQTRQILISSGLAGLSPEIGPVTREVNGLKLAFLAFDDVSQPLELQPAVDAVKQAALTADVVIVSMHWGAEYQNNPTAARKPWRRPLQTPALI